MRKSREAKSRTRQGDTSETGLCYFRAYEAIQEPQVTTGELTLVLVHGFPTVTAGEHRGKKYGHAWLELRDGSAVHAVLDVGSRPDSKPTLVNPIMYYKVGRIVPAESRVYTAQEALRLVVETEHYGPWIPDSEIPAGVVFGKG